MGIIDINKPLPDGLTPGLIGIFDRVSRLECIKGLYLCGGTAQSIQMNHRLSEDLDFELIGIRRDRPELDFDKIIPEVNEVFPGAKTEILGEDHFQIFVTDKNLKLSFFRPDNPVKYIHEGYKRNNLVALSLQDLLGMKIYTICKRSKTRDFYDIYCLLNAGYSLSEGVSYASYLSRHSIRSKDMLSKLMLPVLYPINDEFLKLSPKFDVSTEQMCDTFRMAILKDFAKKNTPSQGQKGGRRL